MDRVEEMDKLQMLLERGYGIEKMCALEIALLALYGGLEMKTPLQFKIKEEVQNNNADTDGSENAADCRASRRLEYNIIRDLNNKAGGAPVIRTLY